MRLSEIVAYPLEALVEAFLEKRPECFDGNIILGQCDEISRAFIASLPKGHDATLVRVSNYQGDPSRTYWRARPSAWEHTLVHVQGRYVDLTARQFDRTAPVPLYMSDEELGQRWKFASVAK